MVFWSMDFQLRQNLQSLSPISLRPVGGDEAGFFGCNGRLAKSQETTKKSNKPGCFFFFFFLNP